jgi:hypothetical protein
MIIIIIATSAFSCAYSWVFDPSLVSHSISPKSLSDGEHENNSNDQGSNPNNQANSQFEQLIAN